MRGFLHMLFAVFAGVAAGWISAVGLIENYGYDAVVGNPQWRERRSAADHPAAPYAFGYFINQGQVPPPLNARHFVRNTDESGGVLRAECIYEVAGKLPQARRWSMTVTDGEFIVSTLGAGEAVYEVDGSVRVFLSAQPVPGNRLGLRGAGAPQLSFTLHDPREANADFLLPSVKRVRC
jgi:hypothetical protein